MHNEPLHIILADDDEDDCRFFKEAFEEVKVKTKITILHDGVELMDYLNNPESILPHVVFLDLNMPRKGGLECLREIRANRNLKDLSIAIYSTSASENDIEETFIQGANIYIRKPDDYNTLKKVLSDVVMINWQYHTLGLNKDNFLLSV
jgi:CheY-like chemotaxis protein